MSAYPLWEKWTDWAIFTDIWSSPRGWLPDRRLMNRGKHFVETGLFWVIMFACWEHVSSGLLSSGDFLCQFVMCLPQKSLSSWWWGMQGHLSCLKRRHEEDHCNHEACTNTLCFVLIMGLMNGFNNLAACFPGFSQSAAVEHLPAKHLCSGVGLLRAKTKIMAGALRSRSFVNEWQMIIHYFSMTMTTLAKQNTPDMDTFSHHV